MIDVNESKLLTHTEDLPAFCSAIETMAPSLTLSSFGLRRVSNLDLAVLCSTYHVSIRMKVSLDIPKLHHLVLESIQLSHGARLFSRILGQIDRINQRSASPARESVAGAVGTAAAVDSGTAA